jgi:hypothetical protein
MNTHFTKNHHFGFEAAAWYWHFVDVVVAFSFRFYLLVGRKLTFRKILSGKNFQVIQLL